MTENLKTSLFCTVEHHLIHNYLEGKEFNVVRVSNSFPHKRERFHDACEQWLHNPATILLF